MRRWLIRILLLGVLLLALAAVAAEIVLRTDVPRRLVLSALQEQTGLRVHAASLRTGWRGRTELRSVAVALPLEPDPFLRIDRMHITHTDLIRLAIFRAPIIGAAEIDQPRLVLRQDAAGRWNILRAAAIIEQAQAERPPAEPPALPRVEVRGGRIVVQPMDAPAMTYAPLSLDGRPDGALAWRFDLVLDQQTIASGHLAPRAHWSHDLTLAIADLDALIGPWLARAGAPPELIADLRLHGQWSGEVRQGVLRGRARLHELAAGAFHAEGEAAVLVDGDRYTVQPANLTVAHLADRVASGLVRETTADLAPDAETAIVLPRQYTLVSGRIRGEPGRVTADRLIIRARDLDAQLDGRWDAQAEAASGTLRWSGALAPWEVDHEGSLDATLEIPRVGRRSIDATIRSRARTGEWHLDTDLHLAAHGREWQRLRGSITARELTVLGPEQSLDLAGFAARLSREHETVRLTHLDLPQARRSRGVGAVNLDTFAWSLDITARDWLTPAQHAAFDPITIDVTMQAAGDPARVLLDHLEISGEDFRFTTAGAYTPGNLAPLNAGASLEIARPANGADLTGHLSTSLRIGGALQPLNLNLDVHVASDDLHWRGRPAGALRLDLRGSVEPRIMAIESEPFALFDGEWRLAGRYDADRHLALLRLDGSDARIWHFVRLADVPLDIDGRADAAVDLALPDLDIAQVHINGAWAARNLYGEGLRGAAGGGRVTVREEIVTLHEMRLEHDGGLITGEAEISLDEPERLLLDLSTEQWPLAMPDIDVLARLNGRAALEMNIVDLSAWGQAAGALEVLYRGSEVAALDVEASIDGRTLDLHRARATLLEGEVAAEGRFFLAPDGWTQSRATVEWTGVDLAALRPHWHEAEPLSGVMSGTLTLQPAADPRAPEPLQIDIDAQIEDGRFGELTLGPVAAEAFLGRQRFMIQHATAQAMDGSLTLWGRLTQHNGEPFAHLHLNLDSLDLQQILDQATDIDQPAPGRVGGWLSAGGYPLDREQPRLFGRGVLHLTESDLGRVPGIADIYSALHVDFRAPEPTGRGEVTVRLEGKALELARMEYFNRGTDIVARLRIHDVWQGRQSPISGLAGGVMRPLRDVELPLVQRFDELIGAIQINAASARISGTLDAPETTVVPFAEVTGAIGRILRGVDGRGE